MLMGSWKLLLMPLLMSDWQSLDLLLALPSECSINWLDLFGIALIASIGEWMMLKTLLLINCASIYNILATPLLPILQFTVATPYTSNFLLLIYE